jgi:carbon-monoxide dehydrogenase large subunit
MKPVNSLIGAAVERVEDLRFLRGRGIYVGDLRRENLVHAVILRSSVAHGRLRSIDIKAALTMPGVHAVITAADIGGPMPKIPLRMEPHPAYVPFEQPVIAYEKVRYVGEPLAVVLADSAALAEDALEAIEVVIDALPAVPDRHASSRGDVLLFEEAGSNHPATLVGCKGNVEDVFADAPYVRRESFRVHRHSAVPLEPRGLLAEWDAERAQMVLYGAAKVPFHNRKVLAQLMGLPLESVTLVENDVGGGFGVRGEFYPEEFLIPFAARHLGRPVQWTEDRRENLLATNHSREADCDLKIACTREGRILGLWGQAYVDMGAYLRTTGSTPPRNIAQVLSGPYRIEHIRSEVSMLVTNKTPSGSYRGPGRFEADFFRERLFDLVALDLRIDRVEFRRRNLIREADMPYELATVSPPEVRSSCDNGDYTLTLDRCLQEIGWTEKQGLQGKLIDGRYHGLAIGCYLEGAGSGREHVRLQLEKDGTVSVFAGSSGLGQGLETVFSQIAADALGFPLDRIRGVFHGSTNLLADGVGAFSSRSVVMGGSALLAAAASLKEAISAAAARYFECNVSEIEIVDDRAVGPQRQSVKLGTLAGDGLSVDGTFASPKRTYSYGAHAAHVTVDPKTGQVVVLDYVVVEDVGRIINPHTLHGQCVGAVVQGLGGTLLEQFHYDENGQFLTGSLADYLMPTASDFPRIRAEALELKPCPNNPLGAKGAGEGGIIPVGAVIANAVAAALSSLGVQPLQLPLSPLRVWEMIQAAVGCSDGEARNT